MTDSILQSATLLTTVWGPAAAAILAALGYLYRNGRERRIHLNEALYAILEVYRLVRLSVPFDGSNFLNRYVAILQRIDSSIDGESFKKEIEPILHPLIATLVRNQLEDFEAGASERLNEAVKKISQYSPLLAMRINGNRTLRSALPLMNAYMASAQRLMGAGNAEAAHAELDHASKAFSGAVTDKMLADFRKDILLLARKCGVWRRYQCWHWFREPDESVAQLEQEKLLIELLRDAVKKIPGAEHLKLPASLT